MSKKFEADDYQRVIDNNNIGDDVHNALQYAKDTSILLKQQISAMDDVLKVQCSKGNWDYDAYMHGMANGMILMRSMFSSKKPEFLDKPENGYLERNDKACNKHVLESYETACSTFIPGDSES